MNESTLTQLTVFRNDSLGIELQAMLYDDKPVFFAIDVAKSLGYENPARTLKDHCKSLINIDYTESVRLGLGFRPKGVILLTEPDLYRLIMRSKLPSAEKVQDWVCEEVLPSIRQTGSYAVEKVQPIANEVPSKHNIAIDDRVVQLARVIAEATASATMKAMAEVITLPSYPTETAAPVYARQPEGEYVPVSKAAWETGLSDSACRKLIGFFKVPVRSNGGLRGLLVNLPEMKKAAERLLRESTAPEGKRKRWSHPQFGNFTCYADLI
ncbi:DNA-binding protein [Salmonella enterica subsp. enterica serovar Muenchen]|nr:DNA-binding protein [Salmonella enterica subsp. enterica serovar Muenchen]